MSENMTGRLTRTVTFADKSRKVQTGGDRRGAGALVYVTPLRSGLFRIRIPGTLLEQDVYLSAIEPE